MNSTARTRLRGLLEHLLRLGLVGLDFFADAALILRAGEVLVPVDFALDAVAVSTLVAAKDGLCGAGRVELAGSAGRVEAVDELCVCGERAADGEEIEAVCCE